jgi:hypothetical protein
MLNCGDEEVNMKSRNTWLNMGAKIAAIALMILSSITLEADAQTQSSLAKKECISANPGIHLLLLEKFFL